MSWDGGSSHEDENIDLVSDQTGALLKEWGAVTSPYYEKMILCRALENTIYFADDCSGKR